MLKIHSPFQRSSPYSAPSGGFEVTAGGVSAALVTCPYPTFHYAHELDRSMAGPGAEVKLELAEEERWIYMCQCECVGCVGRDHGSRAGPGLAGVRLELAGGGRWATHAHASVHMRARSGKDCHGAERCL